LRRENKKWQADYIAPLQLPTLATFRSWESSAGAGRVRPAGAKIQKLTGYFRLIPCESFKTFEI